MRECEVFKSKDLYVNAVVLFTNRKLDLKVPSDPKWFKVIHIKKLTDANLSDHVKNEPVRFSDEEVATIEQVLQDRIGNYDE